MKHVEYTEVVRCRDCIHRKKTEWCGRITYECELDAADPYDLSRRAYDGEWFCADGERGC